MADTDRGRRSHNHRQEQKSTKSLSRSTKGLVTLSTASAAKAGMKMKAALNQSAKPSSKPTHQDDDEGISSTGAVKG